MYYVKCIMCNICVKHFVRNCIWNKTSLMMCYTNQNWPLRRCHICGIIKLKLYLRGIKWHVIAGFLNEKDYKLDLYFIIYFWMIMHNCIHTYIHVCLVWLVISRKLYKIGLDFKNLKLFFFPFTIWYFWFLDMHWNTSLVTTLLQQF